MDLPVADKASRIELLRSGQVLGVPGIRSPAGAAAIEDTMEALGSILCKRDIHRNKVVSDPGPWTLVLSGRVKSQSGDALKWSSLEALSFDHTRWRRRSH